MKRRNSLIRSLAALTLLGVLCLGSACHLWHHLTDPACGANGPRGDQPCATCAALHGGSIATEPEVGALPDLRPAQEEVSTPATVPVVAVVLAAEPRGPPPA